MRRFLLVLNSLFSSIRRVGAAGKSVFVVFSFFLTNVIARPSAQMFRLMERLWLEAGLALPLSPYDVLATSGAAGLIEVVPHAETVADIQKAFAGGGVTGAFGQVRGVLAIGRRPTPTAQHRRRSPST